MKEEYDIAIKKGFSKKDLEDIKTIEEIKKGNSNAFGKIYDKYYDEILIKMTYLYNGNVEKAKDLTSEVMMKVSEVLEKYSVKGGSGKFGGWINKISKNYFIDKTRKAKDRFSKNLFRIDKAIDTKEGSISFELKDIDMNIEETLIYEQKEKEKIDNLLSALSQLDEVEQKLIDLRYYNGLNYKEISKKTGKTENFCRVKMKRALDKMKKIIKK